MSWTSRYGEAKAIPDANGIEVVDTTKYGNDLPLAQCIVQSGEFDLAGTIELVLNCKADE